MYHFSRFLIRRKCKDADWNSFNDTGDRIFNDGSQFIVPIRNETVVHQPDKRFACVQVAPTVLRGLFQKHDSVYAQTVIMAYTRRTAEGCWFKNYTPVFIKRKQSEIAVYDCGIAVLG